MFRGSCVALVTPMLSNGEVDEKSLESLVKWHIVQGTQAIVVCGTTGESATLSPEEQGRVLAQVIAVVDNQIPVIAGTGTYSTCTTIERTQQAQEKGANGCLIVTPYYNRPTQRGLLAHYRAVAQAVDLPIILYNVPSRTGCDLRPETVAELSYLNNIIGIKEATGNMARLVALREQCAPRFLLYSGDDPTAYEFLSQGGAGVISITANVAPQRMQRMCDAVLSKQWALGEQYESGLSVLHRMMIVEPNPIPVKWALSYMGKIGETLRLPLTVLSDRHHANIVAALAVASEGETEQ